MQHTPSMEMNLMQAIFLMIPPPNESTKHSEDTRVQQQYDSGPLNMSSVNMRARKLFVWNVTLSENN